MITAGVSQMVGRRWGHGTWKVVADPGEEAAGGDGRQAPLRDGERDGHVGRVRQAAVDVRKLKGRVGQLGESFRLAGTEFKP